MDLAPRRSVDVCPPACPLIVIASDARADGAAAPTGGYLLVDCLTGERVGGWCTFDDALLTEWGFSPGDRERGANPIALCEGAMVPVALAREARRCRGRRVLWVLDNTSALHSFVSGRCEHATLDRSVKLMNFFKAGAAEATRGDAPRRVSRQFHYNVATWLEWVDSASNWSDGISRRAARASAEVSFLQAVASRVGRQLGDDTFARENGFRTEEVSVDPAAWRGSLLDAWSWVQQCAGA